MVYITIKQPPAYHQMSLEEFLFQPQQTTTLLTSNISNTRTYRVERVSNTISDRVSVPQLIEKLEQFNRDTEHLRLADRSKLYHSFSISKRSGGLRRIDAPNPELMTALRRLKLIFEQDFHAMYHTAAFAYVKNRCTIDAVKRHQQHHSRWFAKLDLHNFFGSTTPEFVMEMFSLVYPFSEVVRTERGREALITALDLAFLNGGLPQGTPISPLITNVMMIPIDYSLYNTLRDFERQTFVYTRYADDFTISSKIHFDVCRVEKLVTDTLASFHAPFAINGRKTRYGSSSGSNWNLGVMLNKDNQITVGNKNKKRFQTMLYQYMMDRKHGSPWDVADIQTLHGLYSYYRMVERATIDRIVEHINQKTGGNAVRAMRADMRV